ncbi:hypothetical protein ACFQ21_05150 [Ohtaekwangia kribbensis]|uniref:Lipoprotein n=1 Tax=Ohtaekwangia kribbensis TaxID=688913 RepID=A0ABW3JXH4_9BACT
MKNPNLIHCGLLALLLLSCKDDVKQSNYVENPNESEISDEDFTKAFDESKAQLAKDSTLKYETAVAQAVHSTLPALVILDGPTCTAPPKKISDLIGGAELNIYKFDQSLAASASAMGFTGSIGKKEMVFIQDFVRFKVVTCGDKSVKMGIGLRCFIHVKSIKGKIGGSLSNIAASVELERAKATFNLKSIGFGIDGSVLADGMSPQGDYNVENFGKLAVTFHKVLKTLNSDNNMEIQPAQLP